MKELQTAMANGDTYVTVHTKDHPKGEIRGQVNLKGEGAVSTSNVTTPTNGTRWRISFNFLYTLLCINQ